jgi:hypothetical protein
MKGKARLILPVWGDTYAENLLSVTLPAALAPGNLPALVELFDVELVIVTETRLFDAIRGSPSFQQAAQLCIAGLVPLDDLMIDNPMDYGPVLTYALFRGFTDLGPRMTETYLIFLNADFILSDGSLCHLGKLMLEGKRVIHAPSFRVAHEDVSRQLRALVDGCRLRLPARQMVRLALAHKHRTVKARIVNQRICHQSWMDQYYWYVDEDTLIGYQLPVALVAIKPQRIVTEPVLVWDFGFIPEAAPTAERHFICDSDDFFMIEPQSRDSGDAMIKAGWISFGDIARNLSMWTTKEQRECGKHLLTIHAGELPQNINDVITESRIYMTEVYRRLSPASLPHIGHTHLGSWFDSARERMRGYRVEESTSDAEPALLDHGKSSGVHTLIGGAIRTLECIYRKTFGFPPQVGIFHPLWVDMWPITSRVALWRSTGKTNILWMATGASLLDRLLGEHIIPAALLIGAGPDSVATKAPYDACVCELTLNEMACLGRLYDQIRPHMKEGGRIIVRVVKNDNLLDGAEFLLEGTTFPCTDISEIHFFGTVATGLLRTFYLRTVHAFRGRSMARVLSVGSVLVALAPIVRLANAWAARRDTQLFSSTWTSFLIEFTIKRARH